MPTFFCCVVKWRTVKHDRVYLRAPLHKTDTGAKKTIFLKKSSVPINIIFKWLDIERTATTTLVAFEKPQKSEVYLGITNKNNNT